MKQTTTKRRVLASFLSLALCVSMLVGSTYAWFTDTVTSSGNIIKSGTLDVGMLWADGDEDPDPESNTTTWNDVESSTTNPSPEPIFGYELWEPGYAQVRHIQVVNKGSLALKYNLTILATGDADDAADLAEVIDVYTKTPAVQVTSRGEIATVLNRVGTLREVLNDTTVLAATTQGHLSAGDKSAVITIALKMQELAGNEYQNKQINAGFDVRLFATQWTEEKDTFDEQYDKMATYDSTNVGSDLTLADNGVKVTVPAASANVNDVFELDVTDNGTNTDTYGKTTAYYDIKLIKNGVELVSADANETEYTVELNVGKNLDVVGVYHNSVPVLGWSYDSDTGVITFTTKSFSPFTVEYHAPKQITFNANTGSGTMEKQNVYAGVEKQLDNNAFSKTGYSFTGWATSADGEVVYNDGAAITITESATLYAKWEANPYEVSFNANGGTGGMANLSINYDQTKSLTAVGFTRTGYSFAGWATSADGNAVYADGADYTMQSTSTVTLYAVWTANEYTLTFNANGGEGSMSDLTITYDDTAVLTANVFTKTGYIFAGWATSADGNAVYADGADYTMQSTSTVTLYAVWHKNVKYLEYNTENGTFTEKTRTIHEKNEVTSAKAMYDDWYYVEDTVTVDTITVNGTAHLILCDGAKLTVNRYVKIGSGSLNIYAQSDGDDKGILESPGKWNNGISGTVTIHGGKITAINTTNGNGISGTVTIHGGEVTATGGDNRSGIRGTVTINGGTVTATGGMLGAGIGGNTQESGGTVIINGGTVTAKGGSSGAGIGGGYYGSGGTVTINGGTVTATGSSSGAGIGGGYNGAGANVTINGGTVTAIGGSGFGQAWPGIGRGEKGSDNGTLTVADGLAVFGGGSPNPTTEITNYATNRPRYMVVKAKPAYADQLSNGYLVTQAIIDEYRWLSNITDNAGLSSSVFGKWKIINITEAEACALAEYKGAGSVILFSTEERMEEITEEIMEGITYSFTEPVPYVKCVKYDGTSCTVTEVRWSSTNLSEDPLIFLNATIYGVMPA